MTDWIKVSERLPDPGKSVLILTRCHDMYVAKYNDQTLCWDIESCCIKHEYVTHWMPLPELPEEENA